MSFYLYVYKTALTALLYSALFCYHTVSIESQERSCYMYNIIYSNMDVVWFHSWDCSVLTVCTRHAAAHAEHSLKQAPPIPGRYAPGCPKLASHTPTHLLPHKAYFTPQLSPSFIALQGIQHIPIGSITYCLPRHTLYQHGYSFTALWGILCTPSG